MLVSARIEAIPASHFLVPKAALHDNSLYFVDANTMLHIQSVEVLFRTGDQLAVRALGGQSFERGRALDRQ